ncbi:hypothetical protein ACFR9U_03010 [Halorientalis brevis]|uniref:DUF7344 domain-containing protein n=1 Tax=Halorientalis brevis TaxID=1126241 RepID=A0ABD6C966_9EURY|nr:hypothetical protein [Halorientalis brevis]
MRRDTDRTVDELLRALAHPHRRRLLRRLHEQQTTDGRDTVSLTTVETALDATRERAQVALHHRHLPALQAVGLVEHASDEQTDGGTDSRQDANDDDVAPGPRFERGITVLEALDE